MMFCKSVKKSLKSNKFENTVFNVFSLLFSIVFVFSCLSCNKNFVRNESKVKAGFIYYSSVDTDGYSRVHNDGRMALEQADVSTFYVEDVKTEEQCIDAMKALIGVGCNIIYATSFDYQSATLKVAAEYPDIKFAQCGSCQITDNVSCYFGKVYEVRYLSGIVAGLKTTTGKIGYVAAVPSPEVIRGINAFALGVRSVRKDAVVEVMWIDDWDDSKPDVEEKETLYADYLCSRGCDVLTQHVNGPAVQLAARKNGKYCIGYNTIASKQAPKSYLTSPVINWKSFYLEDALSLANGTWESRNYWEGLDKEMVDLDRLSRNCIREAKSTVLHAKTKIIDGSLQIFEGPIYNNRGDLIIKEGQVYSEEEIYRMDWFVEGVNPVIYKIPVKTIK